MMLFFFLDSDAFIYRQDFNFLEPRLKLSALLVSESICSSVEKSNRKMSIGVELIFSIKIFRIFDSVACVQNEMK